MFQEARMKLKLTRNKVADLSDGFFNESRPEKIETGKLEIYPEEVVKLAEIYKDKELCSTFCATECPVGIKRGMKVVKEKNLSQIVLEMLATLQSLDEKKVRLIEMTVDGKIDDKEIRDFKIIQDQLKQMEETIHSLQLWIEHYVDKNWYFVIIAKNRVVFRNIRKMGNECYEI